MEVTVLNDIPLQFDMESLFKQLHMDSSKGFADRVRQLAADAETVGKPKALYKPAFIESKGDDYVIIEGIKFKSRVLKVNLEEAYRVFPYLATCGKELEQWSESLDDMFDRFCADAIKQMALNLARKYLVEHIDQNYNLAHASKMSPGSLTDWPISEQKNLFDLLGNTQHLIGMTLTPSFLMTPIKSVSGIRFPKETTFESCQLCPNLNCPGRKAPYDKDLYEREYRKK